MSTISTNLPITPDCHEAGDASRQQLVQKLQGKIRRVETASRNDDGTIITSGSQDMDNILPAGGYNRGTIIEWISENGSGAEFLSLLAAKNAAADGGAIVIIDQHAQFFPPAARAIGINLGNLIVLHGTEQNNQQGYSKQAPQQSGIQENFLWSIDQSLRCGAVAAVWGELPTFENEQSKIRWLRRFQLSAESSGCCGMFTKPLKGSGYFSTATNTSSWAEIQWQITPLLSKGEALEQAPFLSRPINFRRLKATLTRCRGGIVGRSIDLEINTVTGNVRKARCEYATSDKRPSAGTLSLAAQLAHPKNRRRAARA